MTPSKLHGVIAAIATAGYGGLLTGPPFVGAIATLGSLRLGFAALAAAACAGALISMFATPSDGRKPN